LCEKVGPREARGAFPTPRELAAWTPSKLARACKVGYRAERIIRLARAVASGELDLSWFEAQERTTEEVYEALLAIHGFGAYAAGNVCQLLGRYDRLAIDTETYRHFEQEHNLPRGEDPKRIHPRIEAHYAKYAPFQFLAYWFDLWQGYQKRFGPAWEWDLATHAHLFTVSVLRKKEGFEGPRGQGA
jgi:3-methyladenine DNA glycosylase/8-oxoguanine DNA glycosylase